jgi:beta-lactamase regulating signal transducer with metallopeptidase domain/HEAT repeat protein
MNTFPLSEPLVQRLAWTLIHFAWQGFSIALLLALAVGLGRVRRSNWRYSFSLVALVAMTVSPIATFMVVNVPTQIEQPVQYPQAMTTQSSIPHSIPDHHQVLPQYEATASDIDPASVTKPTTTLIAPVSAIDSPPTDTPLSFNSNPFTWQRLQPWIVSVWICGVALLSGRLLIGGIGVWQIRRRGISAPGWLVEQTQRLAGDLRMACPELKVSHRVQEAIALGFLRPMVLLPAAWVTQMPLDMFEAVLVHELAHIRRHDLWVNLFQRVVETLLFYHPAVWWLSRRLRIERELCCDELVVRVTRNPLRYAETLEHIGRLSLASRSAPLIVSIMGSRSMLSVRIRNILRLQPQRQSSWVWLAGVIPLLMAGVVCWSMTTGSNVSAQAEEDQSEELIVSVKFSGNNFHPETDLVKLVTTRQGTNVTPKQIKDDVDALIRTRWFAHVEPIISSTDEGAALTFNVTERPLIRSVEYRGNKKISTEALSKLTQLNLDQPFDVSTNRECVRRIEECYHEKGYPFATIELAQGDLQHDPNRAVVFQIDEGPKVKITRIEFQSARPLDATLPENKASAKDAVLMLSGGTFDPNSSDSDLDSLKAYYHSLGYFDVQITPEKVFSDDKSKIEMNYRIAEGPRYRINSIAIVGNDVISDDELRRLMKVKPGEEYNQRHVDKDIEAVLAKYAAHGRLFAQVHPLGKFPDEPRLVNLVYQIDEDKVYRLRDVQSPKDNGPATIAKEHDAIASGIDESQVGTRRLAFAPIDPKVPFNIRTMTARQPYRQRTELSGGVQVSVEESKCKWQLRANHILVETDSHDKPATGSQDTQIHLRADNYALTTRTPLRLKLSGNISVVCALDNNRNSVQLTADKVTIDFDRSLLFAEKARFKSNETILEGDHIAVSFRGDSFRVGTVPEASSQPEAHSIKANRRLRIGNNDKEGASTLVGNWKLVLPSGKTHELKLTQQDDGCLRLSQNLNLSGTFAYQNKRLELIEPTQDNIFDFIWTLQDDGSFKLTHEQHNVSAKYVGAVLVRTATDSENAAKSSMTKTQQLRSDRTRANDREAARNLVGRWLLTLPTKDLLDVELTAAEDGCLRLNCRKEHDLVGRYSLNGNRLELVDHENQDTDFVWQLDSQNTLKLIAERHKAGLAHVGAKLERIAAAVPHKNVFQIPNEVLVQTRELAANYARRNVSPKSLRPPGLEDLESPDAIKRAVDRAMLLLADSQKFSDGLIQLRYLGDEAFDALVAGSKSENAQVAKWSCSALELRGLKAVGPLSDALKSSPDSSVRSVAASALGQTFQPTAIPALISALDDPDPQVRSSVLNSIKYPRDARAITPLERFVNDPGAGHVASDAIRHIQSPQGYAWWPADRVDLWQLCQDAHTLKGERYRDAELNQLTAGLKSDDGTITYCCLFALGRLRSKESISAIIHAPLSAMKFHVLAEISTPDAIEYLIQRLHSLNPQTRELTIQGLADGADRWAAPLLIALLDDPTLKVEARKMEFTGRPSIENWPEWHRAHSALYSFFSRFGLTGEWRNLYGNQTNNVPEEITNLKAWWKQHGADFVAGKKGPTPNLSTVYYNDP